MATFLVKLDGSRHLDRSVSLRPSYTTEWEGLHLTTKPSKTLEDKSAPPIRPGDTILIWTHEEAEKGNGAGLTAQATAGSVVPLADGALVNIREVRLLKPYFYLKGRPKADVRCRVLRKTFGLRHDQTRYLEQDELAELLAELHAWQTDHRAKLERMNADLLDPVGRALAAESEQIDAAYERQFRMQEVRPAQAGFRAALLALYKGQCLLSACSVAATLNACHIVPFAENIELRTDPANGLLLRADLHALFDTFQLSLSSRGEVHVAPVLRDNKHYGRYHGLLRRHRANPRLLEKHFSQFCQCWGRPAWPVNAGQARSA